MILGQASEHFGIQSTSSTTTTCSRLLSQLTVSSSSPSRMRPKPLRPFCLEIPTGSTMPCPFLPRPAPLLYPILDIIFCANVEYWPESEAEMWRTNCMTVKYNWTDKMQLRFEKKKFHVSKLCILVVRYLTYEIEKILLCTINKVGLRMNVNVVKKCFIFTSCAASSSWSIFRRRRLVVGRLGIWIESLKVKMKLKEMKGLTCSQRKKFNFFKLGLQ